MRGLRGHALTPRREDQDTKLPVATWGWGWRYTYELAVICFFKFQFAGQPSRCYAGVLPAASDTAAREAVMHDRATDSNSRWISGAARKGAQEHSVSIQQGQRVALAARAATCI